MVKKAWEMTRESFRRLSYTEIFNVYKKVKPFRPNAILRRYVNELNKYLKKGFKEKVPQSWMGLFSLLGRVYSDIEAKQPNKIPRKLKEQVAKSYGFQVRPGGSYGLIGFDLVILPDIHRQIVERALKEGKPVPEKVLKDYPDLLKKYGKISKPAQKSKKSVNKREALSKKYANMTKNDLEALFANRSKRSRSVDTKKRAKKVITKPEDYFLWVKAPSRFDIKGIDTPKNKSKK